MGGAGELERAWPARGQWEAAGAHGGGAKQVGKRRGEREEFSATGATIAALVRPACACPEAPYAER